MSSTTPSNMNTEPIAGLDRFSRPVLLRGVIVTVRDGRAVKIEGDPEGRMSKGRFRRSACGIF